MKFFVEPVWAALNYLDTVAPPSDIAMTGISGGGWTTTMYAAIDPRIRRSFPVAGSFPFFLRREPCGTRDIGDWEQASGMVPGPVNYLELYVLGSHGARRKQLQVLNKYDPCCFAGVRYRTYEETVAGLLRELGPGGFAVYLDSTHHAHTISSHAMEEVIGPELQSEDPDNDGLMTWDECPDGPPCPDRDRDGIADYLEPDGVDSDADGLPDVADDDDDGDGLPTLLECPDAGSCTDTDLDGLPDYLEPDDRDTDGDGVPDPQDDDDDGDTWPTSVECPKVFWHCPESVPGAGSDYLRPFRVVDDGDPGTTAASFLKASWGFAGDSDVGRHPPCEATWQFADLPPGRYRLSATWLANGNRSTRAPFEMRDGGTPLATVEVNQTLGPRGYSDVLGSWQVLGGPVHVLNGRLEGSLSCVDGGWVIADALRLDPLSGPLFDVRIPPGGIRKRGTELVTLTWQGTASTVDIHGGRLDRVGAMVQGGVPYELIGCGVEKGQPFSPGIPGEAAGSRFFLLAPGKWRGERTFGCSALSPDGGCDTPRTPPTGCAQPDRPSIPGRSKGPLLNSPGPLPSPRLPPGTLLDGAGGP